MHQCTHCQAELPDRAQFCSHCGTSVPYDQTQSSNDTITEEEPALLEEDRPSEASSQQPGEVVPEEEAGAASREENSANETATASEGSEGDIPEPAAPLAQTPSEENIEGAGRPQPAFEQTDLEGADQPEQGARDEDVQPTLAGVQDERERSTAGRRWLVITLVVLLVLGAGAGAFAFIRQQTSAGASSQCASSQQTGCANTVTNSNRTHVAQLTLSGSISGPMTVSAQVRCQATTTQNLRTLMVTLSGTVGGQLYNFGFVINNYTGPGTYNTTSPSLTILLDVPGEATNNGWSNTSTDSGIITIAHGEQAGNITYVLSGFGTRAGTQVQISGEWTCG